MCIVCSPNIAPERHKLAEVTSPSVIVFRGSSGVVNMNYVTSSHASVTEVIFEQ
jgi:hypothetical protein